VPNPERRLRPGMFARVTLDLERKQDALIVPESSVAYDVRGAYVWRISDESTAERATVELGPRNNGRIVIRRGLAGGDTVVTSGTHKLFAGTRVEVRAPEITAQAE
jgi:membrane fusion protein (multidrug efflux system)